MHREALQMFRASARWADKLSQYNLGVMHYKGEGTEPDPATAWAWFELAAEREYPQMVEAADSLWADLDEDQRKRARIIHDELLPVYGDEVAVERTARYMEREKRKMTGSRVGFIGTMKIYTRDGLHHDGESFYAAERWDYRRLIELEARIFDELARGRVEVREIDIIEDENP
jgi:TPR repeat protein